MKFITMDLRQWSNRDKLGFIGMAVYYYATGIVTGLVIAWVCR